MKKIAIFGSGVKGKSDVVTAQRHLNCYAEIREDGDKAQVVYYGTPGLTKFISLPRRPIRGLHVCKEYLYIVADDTFYRVTNAGTIAIKGTLSSGDNVVSIANNGVQIMVVTGSDGWIYDIAADTFTQITNESYPNTATDVVFNDGYFIVNKPEVGQIWVSSSYDGMTWNGLGFATAESNPDNLIALSIYHGILVLWGNTSVEFWIDQGTGDLSQGYALPMPYVPQKGQTQDFGLAAIRSISYFNNSLVFLGKNLQGSVQVMILDGFTPVRISNHDIDAIINSFKTTSDATALSYIIDGHPMYQLTFPNAKRSFLYDGSTKLWSEVQTGVDVKNRHIGRLGVTFQSKNYISDFKYGNLYLVDATNYTDNRTTTRRELITRHIEDGGNLLTVDEVMLDFETGVGLQLGQGNDPQIMMRVSKDGGRTWGNERWTTIGKVGKYRARAVWRRLGIARDFVLWFACTDPIKFVVTYGSLKVRQSAESQ